MGFRENLKQELNYNDMLVKELAAKTGIKKRALDTYLLLDKASMPPADNAVKIAKALDVTVEYLVTGEETSLPNDIRQIVRRLQKLGKKDRKIVAILTNALINKDEE